MHPVRKIPCDGFAVVKPRHVSTNNQPSSRLRNEALSNGELLDRGRVADGYLSDSERFERPKETTNMFGFDNTVSVSNTSVNADTGAHSLVCPFNGGRRKHIHQRRSEEVVRRQGLDASPNGNLRMEERG